MAQFGNPGMCSTLHCGPGATCRVGRMTILHGPTPVPPPGGVGWVAPGPPVAGGGVAVVVTVGLGFPMVMAGGCGHPRPKTPFCIGELNLITCTPRFPEY